MNNIELEICPCCRGNGMLIHEGGWNVQVECADCGSHTVYVEYNNEQEKAEAERAVNSKIHAFLGVAAGMMAVVVLF